MAIDHSHPRAPPARRDLRRHRHAATPSNAPRPPFSGHGFEVEIVSTGDAARDFVLSRIPLGSEVHGGAVADHRHDRPVRRPRAVERLPALRPRLSAMDRATQGDAIRKLGAAPDVFVNSANAVTEDGSTRVGLRIGQPARADRFGRWSGLLRHRGPEGRPGSRHRPPSRPTTTSSRRSQDARLSRRTASHIRRSSTVTDPGECAVVLVEEAIGF